MPWPVGRPAANRSPVKDEDIRRLYVGDATVRFVATTLGASYHVVIRRLKAMNIPIRNARQLPSTRLAISEAAKKRYEDPAARYKTAKALVGLKRPFKPKSEEHKRKIGEALRGNDAATRARFKGRLVPNRSELVLAALLMGTPFLFNDSSLLVLAGKVPDFVDLAGKRIIELYGRHWHGADDPQERIDLFRQYGFETLVLWDDELATAEEKIQEFLLSKCRS